MSTRTRFEKEAKDNSEMAYLEVLVFEERGKPEYPVENLSEQRKNQQQT